MSVGLIVGVIIFGFVVLVLTGLGILTKAIFEIEEGKTLGQDADIVAKIKSIPTSALLSQAQIEAIAVLYPQTKNIGTGENIIKLEGANLTVAKISLITFWILIIIGMVGFKFFF